VDICPVGALTSKDFRFRQRAWYLKDHKTICTGCSTGCSTKVYYNKEGLFRVKPVYNEQVNGHWMCDVGRDVYKFVNKSARLLDAKVVTKDGKAEWVLPSHAAKKTGEALRANKGKGTALVLTGQHTNEEYEAMVGFFKNEIGSDRIFHWVNYVGAGPESFDAFDGLLLRGDRNPNTRGLKDILAKNGIQTEWKELVDGLASGAITTVVVAGPENQAFFPDLKARVQEVSKAAKLVWLTAGSNADLDALTGDVTLIPLKSYLEKSGTFVNHAGLQQKVTKGVTVVPNALSLTEVADLFAGRDIQIASALTETGDRVGVGRVHNEATTVRGSL